MRCLGIPNTAHFANVTSIADAIACKSLVWLEREGCGLKEKGGVGSHIVLRN